jgi:hypothetical protein
MIIEKHKVFISYHHANDQWAKEHLCQLNREFDLFIDASVDIGDISGGLTDEAVRRKIRDEYLMDSTVTILLVGTETKHRKHVLWELYSSMYDGAVNKKSGLLVVELPTAHNNSFHISRAEEKSLVFPEISGWRSVSDRSEYEKLHPYQPEIIIDNLVYGKGRFSIVPWTKVQNNPSTLRLLIEGAFGERQLAEYDLSRPMRERNYNPSAAARLLYGT